MMTNLQLLEIFIINIFDELVINTPYF